MMELLSDWLGLTQFKKFETPEEKDANANATKVGCNTLDFAIAANPATKVGASARIESFQSNKAYSLAHSLRVRYAVRHAPSLPTPYANAPIVAPAEMTESAVGPSSGFLAADDLSSWSSASVIGFLSVVLDSVGSPL
jgi:hypothetical protein